VIREGTVIHVAMGSLSDTPSIRPSHHIFVGFKAEWDEITDDLPQYAEYRNEDARKPRWLTSRRTEQRSAK
jgi:hypothetical protein